MFDDSAPDRWGGMLLRRALLPADGGWRLSPAYDLNPTPAHAGGRCLATAIVSGDARASLELALETARYYGQDQMASAFEHPEREFARRGR